MAVTPGTRLGPYEITARIGEGGMGEVYRARDTKLNRDVALKVLPEAFTADPDRLARFKREAQLLAALNHPNIAAIHGFEESDGVQALVLELVEGPTLADRIADGPLPIDEALLIAKQIVEALEAAHEQGIIHRDLKPANIKLRPEGTVKILDFGLAKAIEPVSGASASGTMSPTITSPAMTQMGVILGTAAYMAPEQAKGRTADKRSDIWAFGCVLYEMLAGKRAFGGDDISETLAAVLRAEPDWSALPSETPPRIRRLLQRCLNRDLKQRLQAIGEARIAIDATEEVVRRPPARVWPWAAAVVAALVLGAAGWLRSSKPVAQPLMRLSIELPPGQDIPSIAGSVLAISPDGMRIAVITQDETGRRRLNSRRVDAHEFTPLAGTEEAIYPFFSPDGQWIGFFAEGKLKKVSADGGSLATLCDAPDARGASWGDDGNIIAALNAGRSGFSRISSGGGAPAPVTAHGTEKVANVASPHVLPGSKAVVFTDVAVSASPDEGTVRLLSFDTGEQKILQQPGFFGRYVPSGHLIYLREATLHAAPFDIRTLTVTGPSQPMLEDVRLAGLSPAAVLDVSRTGTFVYLTGSERNSRGIFLLDSTGKQQPVHSTPGYYATPRFSPNGTRLAFAASNGPARQLDIWVKDLGAGTMLRLTRMPGANHHPVWTPDGSYLVFESVLGGSQALYWIRSDGGGEPQRLTNDNVRRVPYSFSHDGKWLAFSQAGSQNRGQLREMRTAPVERSGDEAKLGEPELLLQSPAFLIGAQFSPDGRWVAYSSNETGTYEAYVTRFPGPRSKFPISSGGGRYPLWSRSGRELFFVSGDGRIMVTNYSAVGDTFTMGRPSLWSDHQLPRLPTQGHDLAPDGKHLVAILEGAATGKSESVTVLLNFFDELRRRVPGGTK